MGCMNVCGEHSKFDVEYALRGIGKLISVAGYQLLRDIVEKLKEALPNPVKLEEKIHIILRLEYYLFYTINYEKPYATKIK